MNDSVDRLTGWIREAQQVLVFTGAGLSTASGIPDYRGPQGVWTTRKPVLFDDFLSDEAARVRYWTAKTEDWQSWGDAKPNAAHLAVVELERDGRLSLLVTQNVDGLHRRAGSTRLVEVHGTNAQVECMSCHAFDEAADYYARFRDDPSPPQCGCGGWWKPATISFGQALREADLQRAFDAARSADLVLSLGSTLSVTPAAHIPLAAAEAGARYVICNRGETEHDRDPRVALRLDGDVLECVVPAIRHALGE